jgi:uncharacterized protein (DUF736 family)
VPIEVVDRNDDGSDDGNDYRIAGDGDQAPMAEAIARTVINNGWDLLSLQRETPDLEDVFRKLTLSQAEAANV